MADQTPRRWHGDVFSLGDQAYGHLATVALEPREVLIAHLRDDHARTPSQDVFGAWCRDVETHAAAHRVTLEPM